MNTWPEPTIHQLVAAIAGAYAAHMQRNASARFMVALAGGPAAGKSTLAAQLVTALNAKYLGAPAQLLPMDGFHLKNTILEQRGLRHLKGAPQTFDAQGFVDCVARAQRGDVFCAPTYDRTLHDVVDGAIPIEAHHRLMVTEGNYLFFKNAPWCAAHSLYGLKIFIDAPQALTAPRLIQRHMAGGRTAAEALQKIQTTDLPNALLVQRSRTLADICLTADGRLISNP